MKVQRLIAILTTLLQKERASATSLAEKFEVSVRTIYRDMETLEQAGIPIVTHTGLHGGFSIMEQYKIDQTLLTNQDLATLLIALHSVSSTISGTNINLTLEKIKALIPREYGSSIERKSRQLYIDMSPWFSNPNVMTAFETIERALEHSVLLEFYYKGRHTELHRRTVEPHQLMLKENNWYLRGWCLEKQDFRTFKLSRMETITLLPDAFVPRALPAKTDSFQHWTHPQMIDLELIIREEIRERVLDYCREENISALQNGKLAVRMSFVPSEMGYGVLLSFGHCCEVISPKVVKEELKRRIALLQQVYD